MKKIYLTLIIILMFFITGCSEKKENAESNFEQRNMDEILEIVSEENAVDIITKEYSNKELNEIDLLTNSNLEELDSKYRIECLKIDTSEPNSYYKVVFRSKNKFLFIYFDENGEKLYDFVLKMSIEKDKFDSVKIGKTKKTSIYLLDFGNAEWTWSSNFRHDLSMHFTKDGYVITYIYDENGIVIDKKVEMI